MVLALGIGGCPSQPDEPAGDTPVQAADVAAEAEPDEPDVPESIEEIDDSNACETDGDCTVGCFVGVCNAFGECADPQLMECPETDGNTCTLPSCIEAPGPGVETLAGSCVEVVIEDGKPPYASSECWDGAVCVAGEIETADASPTELAEECAAMGADLDPMGCVGSYVCVGGDEKCRPVVKPDETQCWTDDAGGTSASCSGSACKEGECVAAAGFDETCGAADFAEACDAGCQACSQLTCHWIDDPKAVGAATKRVRYCKPSATVGEPCGVDPCKTDEACVLGPQADGPLGKEFLGACGAGADKTKEACLAEMGKPALSCLLAGVTCDALSGGCALDQDIADKWCWPAEGLCWEKDETYCTHLDSGAAWDGVTGCNIAWVNLNCDDGNPCTIGQCKPQLSDFVCDQTKLSGMVCDDGDPCKTAGVCDAGVCAGITQKCGD